MTHIPEPAKQSASSFVLGALSDDARDALSTNKIDGRTLSLSKDGIVNISNGWLSKLWALLHIWLGKRLEVKAKLLEPVPSTKWELTATEIDATLTKQLEISSQENVITYILPDSTSEQVNLGDDPKNFE